MGRRVGGGGVSYFFFNWACDYGVRDDHYLFSPNKERLKNSYHWAGDSLVDCPTQLTLVIWICQLCSTKNNSEKYKRTQQGNLLESQLILRLPASLTLTVYSVSYFTPFSTQPNCHECEDGVW